MNIPRKILIVVGLSAVLSIGIIRWHTYENVPTCYQSPGCDYNQSVNGNITRRQYGYPLIHRETTTFEPVPKNGRPIETVEREGFSKTNMILNVVFWFPLIYLASNIASHRGKKQSEKHAANLTK